MCVHWDLARGRSAPFEPLRPAPLVAVFQHVPAAANRSDDDIVVTVRRSKSSRAGDRADARRLVERPTAGPLSAFPQGFPEVGATPARRLVYQPRDASGPARSLCRRKNHELNIPPDGPERFRIRRPFPPRGLLVASV